MKINYENHEKLLKQSKEYKEYYREFVLEFMDADSENDPEGYYELSFEDFEKYHGAHRDVCLDCLEYYLKEKKEKKETKEKE